MGLPVVWSEEADADLAAIVGYVGERNYAAAVRLWDLIQGSVMHLPDHSHLFKQSERVPGCREIVAHPNYIVVFKVELERIKVLRVLHARQQFP